MDSRVDTVDSFNETGINSYDSNLEVKMGGEGVLKSLDFESRAVSQRSKKEK